MVPAGQANLQDLSGLVPGTYSVVVTDANLCTTNRSVVITQPAELTCTITAPSQEPPCGSSGNLLSASASGGTGAISYLWSVSPSSWTIDLGQGTNSITYTAGGSGPATFTLVVTDANGCTHTCTVTFNCVASDQFCSLTQGAYGNSGGLYCNGMTTEELLDSLLTASGGLVIGVPANNKTFTIPSTGTQCVIDILPGGGTAAVLPGINGCGNFGNLLTKKGTLNNILLAQTITLGLNLVLDPALSGLVFTSPEFYTRSSSNCGEPNGTPGTDSLHFLLPASVYSFLGNNPSVQAIYTLANNALGGVAGLPPLGDINEAVSIINVAFDECRFPYFIPQLKANGGSGSPIVTSESMEIALTIAPNPFKESTQIEFTLSMDSKATVEVYNMLGNKIATLFDGNVLAGQKNTLEFTPASSSSQQVMMCVVRTPTGTEVKRMILVK